MTAGLPEAFLAAVRVKIIADVTLVRPAANQLFQGVEYVHARARLFFSLNVSKNKQYRGEENKENSTRNHEKTSSKIADFTLPRFGSGFAAKRFLFLRASAAALLAVSAALRRAGEVPEPKHCGQISRVGIFGRSCMKQKFFSVLSFIQLPQNIEV